MGWHACVPVANPALRDPNAGALQAQRGHSQFESLQFSFIAGRVMLADMRIPRPTRRWFQFSLRTLLVFVTVCAIPCSWLAVKLRNVKREEAAAAAFEKAGGKVSWDESALGPVWLRGVLGEHFFAHVILVELQGGHVTDSTLEPLDAMNHLQLLLLKAPNVTDAGQERLQGLRELKKLGIVDADVTDAGLEKIAELKELEYLNLYEAKVTDAGLGKLAGLNKLQTLVIDRANVTDAGLEHLHRMKQLKWIGLIYTQVTTAGVKKLQQALPNCKIDFCPRFDRVGSVNRD